MDAACEILYEKSTGTPDLYVRDLMTGYMFLKKYADSERLQKWKKCLRAFDPEKITKMYFLNAQRFIM